VASATSYELADRIAGDRIAVFKGRRADGVMVLMHQLTPGFDHSDVLKLGIAYMLHNPPANGGLIWDLVEREGLTYLITADKTECVDLHGWLTREVGHSLAPEAEVTAEVPHAVPQLAAIEAASLPSSEPKPVHASAAISGPMTPREGPPETAAKDAQPSLPQTSEPRAGLPSPTQNGPAIASAPTSEAPEVYVIAQPKAGLLKTLMFAVVGFLVVAALFWIASAVVRGMK
jgi:hypothetical protein